MNIEIGVTSIEHGGGLSKLLLTVREPERRPHSLCTIRLLDEAGAQPAHPNTPHEDHKSNPGSHSTRRSTAACDSYTIKLGLGYAQKDESGKLDSMGTYSSLSDPLKL